MITTIIIIALALILICWQLPYEIRQIFFYTQKKAEPQ